MAKSYYGYVKRDVENQVDWASITKEMVTTLEEEYSRREKKKEDIDKASREFGKILTALQNHTLYVAIIVVLNNRQY